MAVRISRLRPTQTPHEAAVVSIADFVATDNVLSAFFRPDHPLFSFEFQHLSDQLSFCVRLKVGTGEAAGCAPVFDLAGGLVEAVDKQRFALHFHAVVRLALFWSPAADISRENLRLVSESGEIEWNAVAEYLRRALAHLPFDTSLTRTDDGLSLSLTPHAGLQTVPLTLHISQALIGTHYRELIGRVGHFRANQALKDQLLMHLTRGLLALLTPEQAALRQRARVDVPRQALPSDQPANALAEKLASRVEGLSLA